MFIESFVTPNPPCYEKPEKEILDINLFTQEEVIASLKEETIEKPAVISEQELRVNKITNIIKNLQPKISIEDIKKISELTVNLSDKYELDSYWMLAIMYTESKFENNTTSNKGARGLMQLIPNTAKSYGITKDELYIPEININVGFQYYKDLLNKYDNQKMATIAYNQGPGNVSRGTYRTWYHDRVKSVHKTIIKIGGDCDEDK